MQNRGDILILCRIKRSINVGKKIFDHPECKLRNVVIVQNLAFVKSEVSSNFLALDVRQRAFPHPNTFFDGP